MSNYVGGPRASGDEPMWIFGTVIIAVWSPRERG